MGVAPYTFRNENSVLPVEFKRGSNPPTTSTPLPNTGGLALSAWTAYSLTTPIPPSPPNTADRAGPTANMARLIWWMTTKCATPLRTREAYGLTREHSRPGPL